MNQVINPSILYFGTPVVFVTTVNETQTFNIAPISSVFWNGYRCMIGIAAHSKTTENLLRTKECVINLPSQNMAHIVDKLALTTGSNPVPAGKLAKGYRHVSDKFREAALTPEASHFIRSPLIKECPVKMEAVLTGIHPIALDKGVDNVRTMALELKILRVYADQSILLDGYANHIDPDKWRPLIMSFQKFYGLSDQISGSKLATIPEHLYRTSDTEEALSG